MRGEFSAHLIEQMFDFWGRPCYADGILTEGGGSHLERYILHCDCNSFYASVELLSHPELKNSPVAVCGDPESRHGIILAKNEPAKAFGVKTAETIWQARKKCPGLVLLPAHHERYAHYSRLVNAIYEEYTDLVEPFGIDESWLDISGTVHLFGGDPKWVADTLRRRIREELGLTISVGVSFNKVCSKLGRDYKKPDATTVISRENFRDIVWPLPVDSLLYVGRAAVKLLGKYGVCTIGELAAFDKDALTTLMGKQGGQLWLYANGLENSPVRPAGEYVPPKSVGNGETFPRDLVSEEDIRHGVSMLADSVAVRLRRHQLKASTLQVTIRDPSFRDICRQKPLPAATCVSRELAEAAMELIHASWKRGAPIRALTLTAQHLVPENEAAPQLDLFSGGDIKQRDKLEKLERTMDDLRKKYGKNSVAPASHHPAPYSKRERD